MSDIKKTPKLNSDLALEIQRLMAEDRKRSEETDQKTQTHGETDQEEHAPGGAGQEEPFQGEYADEEENPEVRSEDGENAHDHENGSVTDHEKDKYDHNSGKVWKIIGIVLGSLLILFIAGVAVTYAYEAKKYETVFFDNTYINNIDVSQKTPEEVKNIIKDICKDYEITVKSRKREDETVKASDIGLRYVTGDDIDSILAAQEPYKFYLARKEKREFAIPAMLQLDDDMFITACKGLKSFDDDTAVESVNAYIGDYDPNAAEYVIVQEDNGNRITDKAKAADYIKEKILELDAEADLEAIADEIYPVADICSNNTDLTNEKQDLDRYVKTKISYLDSDIVLDGSRIKEWLIKDENKNISLDDEKIKEFVAELADDLDTVGKERPLKSWYGNDTSVSGGTFGWEVDQEAEFNELKAMIPESTVAEREPVYSKRGIVHGENDWGDTYVEVNLAKQHLFFIKDGQLVTETDVVSGGLQRKAGTPTGVYCINYKGRNAVLRGPRRADGSYEYESPVSYWMPFNKGIGLHDASWRGSFGGNIYKYSGSHGCINLPKKKAKIIYDEIEVGVPVLVYDDDFVIEEKETETETETETKAMKKAVSNPQTQSETQTAAQTESAAEAQAETQPETQPVTQGEVGPGITGLPETEPEAGPGVQPQTEAQITYNAENLPGELQ